MTPVQKVAVLAVLMLVLMAGVARVAHAARLAYLILLMLKELLPSPTTATNYLSVCALASACMRVIREGGGEP